MPPDSYLPDDPVRQDDPVQQTPMPERPHQDDPSPGWTGPPEGTGTPGWTRTRPRRAHPGRSVVVLLGLAACMLVALLVVLALNSGQREVPDAPATPAPAAPSVAVAPPPAPTPPAPAELEQTVRTYYRLLPGNTTAAWEYLSPAERAASGGFSRYVSFWNQIDDVGIRGPVDVQGDTVLVNLQFDPKNRGRTLERYQLTMGTAPDGRLLIESAESLGTIKADSDRGGRDDQGNQGGGRDDQGGGRDDNRGSGSGDDG